MSASAAEAAPRQRTHKAGSGAQVGALSLAPSCLLAALGGLLTAGAFPPAEVLVCAVAGPALLVVAVRGQTPGRGAIIAGIFGVVFQAALLQWLGQSIGPVAWLALSLVQGLWFAALGALLPVLARLPGWPLWFAVAWSATEAGRGAWPFGGMPWGRLGFTVVDSPLESLLPYFGVSAIGWLFALAAALVAELARPMAWSRKASLVGLVAWVAAALATVVVPHEPTELGRMTTAVVQGGVPGDGRQLVAHHREVTQNHVEATLDLAARVRRGEINQPRLVIWPENSTAVDPLRDPIAREAVETAAKAARAPILVGGVVDGPSGTEALNQGIAWGTTGPGRARYTKQHLVPFGEYIPFRETLGGLSPRLAAVPRDMVPGPSADPLRIVGVPIADAICFDVAYDDVISEQVERGARLVVVQTSNASFAGTTQLDQQFAVTRARALETGRAVAVASTTGITALVGPRGEVVARLPLGVTDYLIADMPLSDTLTPAVRWGRSAAPASVLLAAGGFVLGALRARRTRGVASKRQGHGRTAARRRL